MDGFPADGAGESLRNAGPLGCSFGSDFPGSSDRDPHGTGLTLPAVQDLPETVWLDHPASSDRGWGSSFPAGRSPDPSQGFHLRGIECRILEIQGSSGPKNP